MSNAKKCPKCGGDITNGIGHYCPPNSPYSDPIALRRQLAQAEAEVERLEAHDVEMAKWLESKSYALALALGVPGDEQTPPTDELIERVKRLREALERIAKCKDNPDPMGYLPAIAAEALATKEASDDCGSR